MRIAAAFPTRSLPATAAVLLAAVLLTACGGGSGDSPAEQPLDAPPSEMTDPVPEQTSNPPDDPANPAPAPVQRLL